MLSYTELLELVNGKVITGRSCAFARPVENAEWFCEVHNGVIPRGKPEYWERKDAEEFDYGYALTVHKSQGSQWNNVLLFDEWYGKDRKEWLYTAITRAAERIDLVMM